MPLRRLLGFAPIETSLWTAIHEHDRRIEKLTANAPSYLMVRGLIRVDDERDVPFTECCRQQMKHHSGSTIEFNFHVYQEMVITEVELISVTHDIENLRLANMSIADAVWPSNTPRKFKKETGKASPGAALVCTAARKAPTP